MDNLSIGPVVWVNSKRDVKALIEAINGASEVVYDLETTGLNEHARHNGPSNGGVAARVAMAGFTLPQADDFGRWDGNTPISYVVPLSHRKSVWSGQWRKLLRLLFMEVVRADRYVVGHHVKFDNRWIYASTGIDLSERVAWDTQNSSHLLDENNSTRLEAVAARTYGIPEWGAEIDLSKPGAAEEINLMTLGEYQARDTWYAWRLLEDHRNEMRLTGENSYVEPMTDDEIQAARLGKLATWVAMPTVATLSKVEQRGLGLDIDWVRKRLKAELEVAELSKDTLSERWNMVRDSASLHATAKWFQELTERAVDGEDLQVASLTKTGKAQWNKAVLEKQARLGSETAKLILAGRNGAKRAEYLQAWLNKVSPDGTIHANYNVGGTSTGRLSSSDPNMQQVTAQLKPAFIPRPGYVLAEIDYSQIELRVAAHISQCQPMIEAFNEGHDLHRLLGARIAKKSLEDVTADERQKAKSANFGLLYGMGAMGFQLYAEAAYGVDISMEEAYEIHQMFFDQWEGMREWHIRMARLVNQRGEVTSPIGRVRRLPEALFGDDKAVAEAERKAANAPVQGFASDLMQMAASSITGTLPGYEAVRGAHVVGTVHDSIMVELDESVWRDALRESLYRMTEGLQDPLKRLGCELTVPLAAEAAVGTRWGLEDIKTEDEEV